MSALSVHEMYRTGTSDVRRGMLRGEPLDEFLQRARSSSHPCSGSKKKITWNVQFDTVERYRTVFPIN